MSIRKPLAHLTATVIVLLCSAAAAPGDTITFNLTLPATITLTSAALMVDKNLSITGPGPARLTVERASNAPGFPVVFVTSGVTATLSGLTITGGAGNRSTPDVNGVGGGIANFGNLTISNAVIAHNSADLGGGIWTEGGGTLTVIDSSITYNTSGNPYYGGGAIFHCCTGGTTTVLRSTIARNHSHYGSALSTWNENIRTPEAYAFGPFVLQATECRLMRESEPLALTPDPRHDDR